MPRLDRKTALIIAGAGFKPVPMEMVLLIESAYGIQKAFCMNQAL
jgi:hypothetical protein